MHYLTAMENRMEFGVFRSWKVRQKSVLNVCTKPESLPQGAYDRVGACTHRYMWNCWHFCTHFCTWNLHLACEHWNRASALQRPMDARALLCVAAVRHKGDIVAVTFITALQICNLRQLRQARLLRLLRQQNLIGSQWSTEVNARKWKSLAGRQKYIR